MPGATSTARTESTQGRWRWLLPVEILTAVAAVLATSVVVDAPLWLATLVLGVSLLSNYHAGRETVRPGLPHLGRILRDTGLPVLAVAVGVSAGLIDPRLLPASLTMVGVASAAAVGCTWARRVVQGHVRIMVVGDRMAIAKAATRWAGDPRAKIVGALLLEAERNDEPMPEAFGVHTIRGVDEVAQWVATWRADMVVVAPGPGIASPQLRSLSWDLEGTDASLAVLGILDLVAPHRIDSSHFAGVTLMHVRSSRPSGLVRLAKAGVDRILGAVLLLFFAPLLMAMVVAVRAESRGPGIFTQTRVGQGGRPFTIFKMRTMRSDAEQLKASLSTANEGNGVLFKIKRDPRITRVGQVLRKTSLDELPQLINVVRGEMSLVGPRPALPEEVAVYTDSERRRLAVRPGMTGLWQVSGRSNLNWERSVELDLHYADNWRLCDDLMIGVKTVDAVARSRGAY